MFATGSRSRRHQARTAQTAAEAPLPGSDSCFGVRSLNGSVEWETRGEVVPETSPSRDSAAAEQGEGVSSPPAVSPSSTDERASSQSADQSRVHDAQHHGDEGMAHGGGGDAETRNPPVVEQVTAANGIQGSSLDSPPIVPSLLLPSLSLSTEAGPSRSSIQLRDTVIDTDREVDLDSPHDGGDESGTDASSPPPSPTSLSSMPSYFASDVDLSRTSSPMGYLTDTGSSNGDGLSGTRSRWRHTSHVGAALQALARERSGGEASRASGATGMAAGMGEVEPVEDGSNSELVLPTLSLPSSSLHLGLPKYAGIPQGVKVALLGEEDDVNAIIRHLSHTEDLVALEDVKGGLGILRNREVVLNVVTGLSAQMVKTRVLAAYTTLHGLLNPSASTGSRDATKLSEMAQSYADREDWIHAVIVIDEERQEEIKAIVGQLVALSSGAAGEIDQTPVSRPRTPSPLRMDDPTPMARTDSTSYFQQQDADTEADVSEVPETHSQTHRGVVERLRSCISESRAIKEESINRFLSWRPPALESSASSLETNSPVSQSTGPGMSSDKEPPMPTVARAQGGGEWEAGLSRRLAKRKEKDTDPRQQHRASRRSSAGSDGQNRRGRRRRSKTSRDKADTSASSSTCLPTTLPLFPYRRMSGKGLSTYQSGLGVKELIDKTFGAVRRGMRGWRGVAAAVVVLGVVGWGVWASSRYAQTA